MSVREDARRMLVVLYQMAGGSSSVAISQDKLFEECERLGVMDMTMDEFDAYHRRVLAEVRSRRN